MNGWRLMLVGILAVMGCEKNVREADGGGARPIMASDKSDVTKDGEGKAAKKFEKENATTGPAISGMDPNKPGETVMKTEEEWKKILTPEQYRVLREKGTERAFTGKYDEHFEKGAYVCAACGLELFTSETKFNSGCGWPAFYAAKAGDRVKLTKDLSHGMVRTEVTCSRCGSHLGHVFDDAPDKPTGQRYCINSVSLKFVPATQPSTKKSE